MNSFLRRRHNTGSAARGRSATVGVILTLAKVFLPLIAIAALSFFVLNFRPTRTGQLRVSTSVPGAEIVLGGTQTGLTSDTTLIKVPVGRKIVTVRKPNFVSDPEFSIVQVGADSLTLVNFRLRPVEAAVITDSIPPLRSVRQEIFSTGEAVVAIPPAPRRSLITFEPKTHSRASRKVVEPEPQPKPDERSQIEVPESPSSFEQDRAEADVSEQPESLQGTEIAVTSTPEGATITVNGSATTRTTPYTFRGLDRGMYVFKLQAADAVANPESVVVDLSESYQQELASFNVVPDPSIPKPTLTVSTEPLAAGIFIDGKNAGVGSVTLELPYGAHQIDFAEAPGFTKPEPMAVELSRDQPHVVLKGTFEKLIGNSFLALIPGEDFEKFDPTQLRVFVDNELVLDSPDSTFDVTLLKKIAAGKRLVRVQYGPLTNDVHVDLEDGQVAEIVFRIESFFSKRSLRLRDRSQVSYEKWQEKSRRLTVLSLG